MVLVLVPLVSTPPRGGWGPVEGRGGPASGSTSPRRASGRKPASASRRPSCSSPNNASALNDLAVALEQQGEFDKAREAYEKALKLKPGDTYIQQNYDLFREADDKRNRKSKKKP